MDGKHLSRGGFIRLSSLVIAGAFLSACKKSLPVPTLLRDEPVIAVPTEEKMGQIVLNGCDADVWSWWKRISGKLIDLPGCQGISLNINGDLIPVECKEDTFTGEAPLKEGDNLVFAIYSSADGTIIESNRLKFTVRLHQKPTARIQPKITGEFVILDSSLCESDHEKNPLVEFTWYPRPGNPGKVLVRDAADGTLKEFSEEVRGTKITILLPPEDGEYYFNLIVADATGGRDTSRTYILVENGQPRIPDYDHENPTWIEKAVVYGVIPRKFGDLGFNSITQRLDYLAELGVNALWLAPINLSPVGDYGYAVVDYFDLNPAFGTKNDFKYMVDEAHKRGIRILMDFVPNHTSIEHPYFVEAASRGKESHYWDYYDRDAAGNPTHYFEWTHLPNLNYNNPEVERWILEAFVYWVREFDVDGFRVDVAWGVKERKPDFWPRWRAELKRIKPDLLLLAEASARDPYYFDFGFDAAYDWTDQLGKWAWELVWGSYKNRLLTYNLDVALTNRPQGFHPDALIFRFLNNNDTGTRFITTNGIGMTRVSTALLLTLPGIPCIYTGDEMGAEFHPYRDPQPLTWENAQSNLYEYHKKLISLRQQIPSLHSRLWMPVELQPVPQEVYGYIRYTGQFQLPVILLFNFFDEPADVVLKIPGGFSSLLAASTLYDVLGDEEFTITDAEYLSIKLPGMTARILVTR